MFHLKISYKEFKFGNSDLNQMFGALNSILFFCVTVADYVALHFAALLQTSLFLSRMSYI